MLRNTLIVAALFASLTTPASAQESYPVAVGLGLGIQGERIDRWYHGMAVVTVTPPWWPIALRLDGVVARRGEQVRVTTSALSASAVITLRPWRVAPYLIVGSSRIHSGAYQSSDLLGGTSWRGSRTTTDLTGGLGLKVRFGSKTLFTEMRSLGQVGTPLTIGFTF